MRRSRRNPTGFLSLDSLVDIVTNNVGILIILSAFMALFALLTPSRALVKSDQPRATPPPPRLEVPWSHPTNKQTLFFVVRDNRIQYVDMKSIYQKMLDSPPISRAGKPVTLSEPGMGVRFFPITNQVYCFEFAPKSGSGETWNEAKAANSRWHQVLSHFSRENFVYFFWVSGDSFELFRDVRKTLLAQQIEVGWKPVKANVPLDICNGFEGSNTFQPQ